MAASPSVELATLWKPYTRPKSGLGLWLAGLLPVALLVNVVRHPVGLHYKTVTVLAWAALLVQLQMLWKSIRPRNAGLTFGGSSMLLTGSIASLIIGLIIGQNPLVAIAGGLFVTFVVEWTFFRLLRNFPKSFTIGEAAVVSQGLTLFLFNSLALDLPGAVLQAEVSDDDDDGDLKEKWEMGIRNIVQLGVLLIFILIGLMRTLGDGARKLIVFIPLAGMIVLGIISIPVTQPIPILFVLEFLFSDWDKIFLLLIFGGLLIITGLICCWQVWRDRPSSTATRKLFHILIVIVFLVGVMLNRLVLFLCAGVVLALFFLLEAVRVGKVEFFSSALEQTVVAFKDGQDAGILALTPIYLLLGCASPLFLSPVAFFSGQEMLLPLVSGVISIGVGDSFAGVVGTRFGRHRLKGSFKSIEGTVANAVSQIVTLVGLTLVGFLPFRTTPLEYIIIFCGVIANAVIEAKTDQIDNLVVPLVTFIAFSLV